VPFLEIWILQVKPHLTWSFINIPFQKRIKNKYNAHKATCIIPLTVCMLCLSCLFPNTVTSTAAYFFTYVDMVNSGMSNILIHSPAQKTIFICK
jgi:hypothetical protein